MQGLGLSEYDYLSERTDWHYHENPYFMFLLKGKVMDVNSSRSIPCESGTLLFQNWQDPHYNAKYSELARGFHLEIDKDWLQAQEIKIQLESGNNDIKDPIIVELFVRMHREIQEDDPITNEAIQDLIWQLLNRLSSYNHRVETRKPKWIDLVEQMVEELDADQLTLERVSSEIGLHPAYFCREFPRHFQASFGNYVRKTKLKRTLPLMGAEQYSLAQIAIQCGFADQSHLTRCFKKYYGITPMRYRTLLQKL